MQIFVFPAVIHKENGVFGLVFPDLPGCVTVGDTQAEIAINAAEALSGHLEVMMDFGDRIPEPRPLEDIMIDPDAGDISKTLVTAYAAASKPKTIVA